MNDRYLYRAKRVDNWGWVEGNLVWSNDADDDYKAIIIPTTGSNMFTKGGANGDLGFEKWYRVDPSTICQCTGLKDKNGKLIWENDIVKRVDRRNGIYLFREQPSMNCKVVWTDKYGFDTLPSCGYFDKNNGLECEVIGNIFDNPELLEVGE